MQSPGRRALQALEWQALPTGIRSEKGPWQVCHKVISLPLSLVPTAGPGAFPLTDFETLFIWSSWVSFS